MNGWQRWLQAPATHWLRRILFQIHLWLGIGFGLYILIISISGSAIILRPQFARWMVNSSVEAIADVLVTQEQVLSDLSLVYEGYSIVNVVMPPRAGRAVYVMLEREGKQHARYYDHYRGVDLGPTFPWQLATVEWLTRLHDELFLGRHGVKVNGVGGVLFLFMLFTGLLLWWQGSKRWHYGLLIHKAEKRGLLWQLHGILGFWCFLLMFVWGFTAVYFAWPAPFDAVIDWFDSDLEDFERPDGWLLFLLQMHFGRFRGVLWPSFIWIILGLIPAFMFISGCILWYRGRQKSKNR